MLTILLLIGISWLLWTIHQDLMESNDRQRTLKTELSKLGNRLDQAIEANLKDAPASKASEQGD